MIVKGLLLSGFVAVATGMCSCQSDSDPVVGRVGSVEIRASRLARFVERLPEGLHTQQQGREAIRDHLQSVVDQQLLLDEATSRGIPALAAVDRDIAARGRGRLAQAYLKRQVAFDVEVSPEEVERVFRDRGYDRERMLARIIVPSREEARQVVEALERNASFDELAERYASNDPAAGLEGELGWLGIDDVARYRIPEHIFFSLEDGRVAQPVDLGGVWQVYSFRGSREAEFEALRENLHDRLVQERWRVRLRSEYESLARRYGLVVGRAGLATLLAATERVGRIELTPEAQGQPLYQFEGHEVTVGDYLYQLGKIGFRERLKDSTAVAQMAESIVLPERLYATAARELGWHQEEAYHHYYARERRELILRSLAQDELERRGRISAADVEAYYQEHPDHFRKPEQVLIRRLYVHTREKVLALRQKLEAGAPMEELLQLPEVAHHVRPGSGGRLRLFPIFRARFPELVDAAFAAAEGELVGPVPMAEGWAVFRVLEKKQSQVEAFAAVQKRAGAMLRQQREVEIMSELIGRLREERRDQIALYPERVGE